MATFHELHHGPDPLLLPNAWDHASAAALLDAGFPAIGTTSLGVAAAAGLVDGTGAARDETLTLARRLSTLPVPVTVDIEGGFSEDPAEVAAFVAELAALGMAGVNLEDGRGNDALADPHRQAETVRAVKDAAPGIFLNARVDTHWLGLRQAETLERVRHYAGAGADGIFVPALRDPAAITELVAVAGVPVNLLYLPDGPSVRGLGALGVRRVSTGSMPFRAALGAAVAAVCAVRDGDPLPAGIPSYAEIQSRVG